MRMDDKEIMYLREKDKDTHETAEKRLRRGVSLCPNRAAEKIAVAAVRKGYRIK